MRGTRILVVLLGVVVLAVPALAAVETYGTTATSYQSIGPNEFFPTDSTASYSVVYTLNVSTGIWTHFLSLPSGALLKSIDWDFCDSDGGDSPSFGIFRLTRTGGENGGIVMPPAGYTPGCHTFHMDISGLNFVLDNHDNRMIIYLSAGSAVQFAGAVVGYTLQVGPAPGAATFADVPASDFGFQYIEALAASGITGGCGGGKFCPDSPVTRRQMAIFLAKALGLHWQ